MFLAKVGQNIEAKFTELQMDISARADDLEKDFDKATVVEIVFKEFKLGCLEDGLQASVAALVVIVATDHFDKIFVNSEAMNYLRNKRHQVAEERESMYLELLLLRGLPAAVLRIL